MYIYIYMYMYIFIWDHINIYGLRVDVYRIGFRIPSSHLGGSFGMLGT